VPRLHVVNLFTALDRSERTPLGVFVDGAATPEAEPQAIAVDLNYSETVFVDDHDTMQLQIFTPTHQLLFTGHPLVVTSWLVRETPGSAPEILRPPAGEVRTWAPPGSEGAPSEALTSTSSSST